MKVKLKIINKSEGTYIFIYYTIPVDIGSLLALIILIHVRFCIYLYTYIELEKKYAIYLWCILYM